MKNLRIIGNKLVFTHELVGYRTPGIQAQYRQRQSGKLEPMRLYPYSSVEAVARTVGETWFLENYVNARAGQEVITGTCEVEVDLAEVLTLCINSARHKNPVAVRGPVTVRFRGKTEFEPTEEVNANETHTA